jgi:hypothetical protein
MGLLVSGYDPVCIPEMEVAHRYSQTENLIYVRIDPITWPLTGVSIHYVESGVGFARHCHIQLYI